MTNREPRSQAARRMRRREIAAAVQRGLTAAEAAGQFSVGESYVRRVCQEFGVVPVRARRGGSRSFTLDILAALQSGLSQEQTAEKIGVSPAHVCRLRQDAERAGLVLSLPEAHDGKRG